MMCAQPEIWHVGTHVVRADTDTLTNNYLYGRGPMARVAM
jgi:hypothetical protein